MSKVGHNSSSKTAPTQLTKQTFTKKLTGKRYGVGVMFDQIGRQEVTDIDLQAVIVDKHGLIVDAVYYNNSSALGGAIGHTGDDEGHGGDNEGVDEAIWCTLDKLPADVALILFVVAAHDSGGLNTIDNGEILLFEEFLGRRVHKMPIENTSADVDVVCMLRREGDTFQFEEIETKANDGSHFLDILEPTIGGIIRAKIPHAPEKQKVSFEMKKGAVTDLPKDGLQRIQVGIGATLLNAKVKLDIDIVAVAYSAENKRLGNVDGTHRSKFGMTHTGDHRAGEHGKSAADDEAIMVALSEVPKEVAQIFFLMLLANGTFGDVKSAYARVTDQSLRELAAFQTSGGAEDAASSGAIVGRLVRSPGNRWGFEAIGKFYPKDKGWKAVHKAMHDMFGQTGEGVSKKHKKKRQNEQAKIEVPDPEEDHVEYVSKKEREEEVRQSSKGQQSEEHPAAVEKAAAAENIAAVDVEKPAAVVEKPVEANDASSARTLGMSGREEFGTTPDKESATENKKSPPTKEEVETYEAAATTKQVQEAEGTDTLTEPRKPCCSAEGGCAIT